MTEEEILAKAEQMARQHQQDIINARAELTRKAIEGGYNSDKWIICDNLVDIRAGTTLDYHCWLALRNPTEL